MYLPQKPFCSLSLPRSCLRKLGSGFRNTTAGAFVQLLNEAILRTPIVPLCVHRPTSYQVQVAAFAQLPQGVLSEGKLLSRRLVGRSIAPTTAFNLRATTGAHLQFSPGSAIIKTGLGSLFGNMIQAFIPEA